MDLLSGRPYWLIKNGLPFDYPKLSHDIRTNVVVLGGGISGALTAYHLGMADIETVVLDARTIGLGSTCGNTSLVQYELDTSLTSLINKKGYSKAIHIYKLCIEAIEKMAFIAKNIGYKPFEQRNSLYYASSTKHMDFLKKEFQERKKAGFKVEWLQQKDVVDQYALKAPGAIRSYHGAQMDIYAFTHALHQHNITKSAIAIYDRTNVIDILHKPRSIQLKTAEGYTINCKKLIYATGYETVKYIKKKIVNLYSTYACVSEQYNEPINIWKDNDLIWNTDNPYLYLRTTTDNRIIIGGRDEPFQDPDHRDYLLKKKTNQLARDFRKLFPSHTFLQEFSWTGTFGATADGLPFIGQYKPLPNSYFALGFGGNGIVFSLIAAEILTNYLKGFNNIDAALFSFNRV